MGDKVKVAVSGSVPSGCCTKKLQQTLGHIASWSGGMELVIIPVTPSSSTEYVNIMERLVNRPPLGGEHIVVWKLGPEGVDSVEGITILTGDGGIVELNRLTIAYCNNATAFKAMLEERSEEIRGVDILLLHEWPKGLDAHLDAAELDIIRNEDGVDLRSIGNETIADIILKCKPRYAIVARKCVPFTEEFDDHFRRRPFRCGRTDQSVCTRFISLASLPKSRHTQMVKRWLFLGSLEPAAELHDSELYELVESTTPCPFLPDVPKGDRKRKNEDRFLKIAEEEKAKAIISSRFGMGVAADENREDKKQKVNKEDSRTIYIGNLPPSITESELVSIMQEFGELESFKYFSEKRYGFIEFANRKSAKLCISKLDGQDIGGETVEGEKKKRRNILRVNWASKDISQDRRDCWFCLATPTLEKHLLVCIAERWYCALPKGALTTDHVLIVPIFHYSSRYALAEEDLQELAKIKVAIAKYFKSRNKIPVIFERKKTMSSEVMSHLHIQVVPIPTGKVHEVVGVFKSEAQRYECDLISLKSEDRDQRDYFLLEVYDDQIGDYRMYKGRIPRRFPSQFGRDVLAEFLDMPERRDWKHCKLSLEDETELTKRFRDRFEQYFPQPQP